MNHSFTVDMAEAFSRRVGEKDSSPAKQVEEAFLLAFGRLPDDPEKAASEQLVQNHGLLPLCRALLNSNEFIFLR